MHGLIFGGLRENMIGDEISIRRSIGAHKIATFLREHDYDIEVLDYIHAWSLEELKSFVTTRITDQTLFFGFSSTFTIESPVVNEFIQWLRKTYPNIPTVSGSQNNSMIGLGCDWMIFGFGEYAILHLLQYFQGGEEPKHTNRIINCYDDYRAFPKSDLTVSYEDRDFISDREILLLEFSRGCKFECAFCSFPVLGVKEDHTRYADNLYDELLKNYDRHGTEHYMVLDETFNDSSEKIAKYAEVMKKLPFQPKLTGYIRADLLVSRPKDWDNLIDMGFCSHFYGVESFNYESAKAIGKGMNPSKLQDGLLAVDEYFRKNAGYYKGHISLIAGLPYETMESLREGVKWIHKYWYKNSCVMSTLMIRDFDSPVHELTHFSKFDKSWKDFGYTEAPYPKNLEIKSSNSNFYQKLDYILKNKEYGYISWDNGNFTTVDALKFCAYEFDTEEIYRYNNIDPFTFDKFFIDPDVTWSMLMGSSLGPERREYINKFINAYKAKKLTLINKGETQ